MNTVSRRNTTWWWVVPFLLLAAALSSPYLADKNVWFDEVWSFKLAGADPFPHHNTVEVWRSVAQEDDNHPPLYFITLSGWGAVAGWTPFAGRTLSVFYGMLAVAVTYRLGTQVFSRRVGVYAAALLSSSAFFAYYMREIRPYTLLALMTALTLWLYWRVLTTRRPPGWLAKVGLVFGVLSLPYTNYFGLLPVAAIGLYHLIFAPKNRRWWQITGLMGAGLVLFLPWANEVYKSLGHYVETKPFAGSAMSPGEMLVHLGYVFSNMSLPLLAIPLAYAANLRQRAVRLVWFVTGTTVLLFMLGNLETQILVKERLRYFILLWPLFALLVAGGIDRLVRLGVRPELLIGVWVIAGIWHSPGVDFARAISLDGWWAPDWKTPVTTVEQHERPGDVFATFGRIQVDFMAFDYYTSVLNIPTFFVRDTFISPEERQARLDQLAALTESASRFWLLYDLPPETYPVTPFHQKLWARYAFCGRYPSGSNFFMDLHVRVPDPPLIRFGEGLLPPLQTLELSLPDPLPAEVHDTLDLRMIWAADAGIPSNTYQVVLTLSDSEGKPVQEKMLRLPGGANACLNESFDTIPLDPGTYTASAKVIGWGAPIPGVVTASGESFKHVTLGTVVRVP